MKDRFSISLRFNSFGIKLFATFTLLLLFTGIVFSFFFIAQQNRLLRTELIRHASLLTGVLAYNSRLGVFSENRSFLHDPVHGTLGQEGVLSVGVYRLDGGLLLAERSENVSGDMPSPELSPEVRAALSESHDTIHIERDKAILFCAPVLAGSSPSNPESLFFSEDFSPRTARVIGFVSIVFDTSPLLRNIQDLAWRSVLIVLLFLVLGLAITYLLVENVVRPLRHLTGHVISFGQKGETRQPVRITSHDEIGELAKAFNLMSDSLRRREKALIDSETRYRRMFDDSPIGQWENEFSGAVEMLRRRAEESGQDCRALCLATPAVLSECWGKVIFNEVNLTGLDIFQAGDKQEFLSGINDHLMSASPEVCCDLMVAMAEWRNIFDREYATRTFGGRRVDISIRMSLPSGHDDPAARVLVSVIDITERKQAEQEKERLQAQLQQAQKMEAIGTLAGGIAHDFNNILSAMLGYAQLIQLELGKTSSLNRYLEQILKAGQRARNLVQQILTFSRKADHDRMPVNLAQVVREGLTFLRATLPSTIEIREELGVERAVIMADTTQIQQILMNLGANAAHAMEERGGTLTVRLEAIRLDDEARETVGLPPGAYYRLTVRDTGHGMDQQVLSRIMEPFFTTRKVGQGTGLGLSLVHGIVKSHGGSILVESEQGKGATFTIYLPSTSRDAEIMEPARSPLIRGSEHILYVDDEAALVEVGKELLEYLGYRVTGLTSSREALAVFSRQPEAFDLVITDQTMPSMTGLELAREIRRADARKPVILCTGCSEQVTEESARARGINALVMKPPAVEQLAKTIREVLEGRSGPGQDQSG